MQIWKFPLKVTDTQIVSVPIGGKVLSVDTQGGVICLWIMVDPSAEKENRKFAIIGTGNPMTVVDHQKFIGTVQTPPFVWHIFETT